MSTEAAAGAQVGAVGAALLLARVHDRPGALERLLGLVRRRALAVSRISIVAAGDDTIEVLLRLDESRTPCARARVELLALHDVQSVTEMTPLRPTRELAVARLRTADGPHAATLGRLLALEHDHAVIELTGTPDEIDEALAQLRDSGALASYTRTGEVALPTATHPHETDEEAR